MKIAFDVHVIKDLGITRMVHQVADWGYKYIEQSPHPQINPFYKHPKARTMLPDSSLKSSANIDNPFKDRF
jgi:sugar phosphate isomerase/epimerase